MKARAKVTGERVNMHEQKDIAALSMSAHKP